MEVQREKEASQVGKIMVNLGNLADQGWKNTGKYVTEGRLNEAWIGVPEDFEGNKVPVVWVGHREDKPTSQPDTWSFYGDEAVDSGTRLVKASVDT